MPADAAYNDEFLQILHRVILEVNDDSQEQGHLQTGNCRIDTGRDKETTKICVKASENTDRLRMWQ